MPTELDVINFALNEVSLPAVSSVNQSTQAQLIQNKLKSLLPYLLKRTDWNFALKFVTNNTPIVPPATVANSPWAWAYQLPPDYGQMDRFENGLYWVFPYRIVDGLLLTNQRPIQYWYVVNSVDYSVLPSLFFQALGYLAASRVCLQLTKDETLTKYLTVMFKEMSKEAVQLNDMERYIQSQPHNDYDRQVFI